MVNRNAWEGRNFPQTHILLKELAAIREEFVMKKYSTMSLVPMLTISGDFSAGVQRPTPPQNTHRIKFPVQGVRERYREKMGILFTAGKCQIAILLRDGFLWLGSSTMSIYHSRYFLTPTEI